LVETQLRNYKSRNRLKLSIKFRVRRYFCNSGLQQGKTAIIILSNFQPVRKIKLAVLPALFEEIKKEKLVDSFRLTYPISHTVLVQRVS
jgi:hypothetical protein